MSALSRRPIELPVIAPNAPCLGTSSRDLGAVVPNYGFGLGPAYLSGQDAWYSRGQVAIVLLDARYPGPLLVRGVQLSGEPSTITLAGFAADPPLIADKERRHGVNVVTPVPISSAGLFFEAVPPSSFWRASFETLSTTGPGCFGLQMDGDTFTELIVFPVEAGTPPPG